MANIDRKKEIILLLENGEVAKVAQMSKRFGVTEETIRRDLDALEKEGHLIRTHGGAILNRKEGTELPLLQREGINLGEKRKIGFYGASLVEEGDVISLDASTTCLLLAKQLLDIDITVITYSVPIAYELARKSRIRVFLIGGYVDRQSLANTGAAAEKMIEGYHVDKCFISCKGFDWKRGISEPYESQSQIKRKIMHISEQIILLADSHKFQKKSLIRLAGLEEVDIVVTDSAIPHLFLEEAVNNNIEVIVTK
ncbi:DeoR/GlpR family DNA-binding transcription regulator [Paenibacillus sp. IITD108]|uniref:DeoR/GlpR family DNA-binding transcription regulator n=1 Tax=Paenibacillus sp. IITD108 TaxID=3116649 RepID=UPI002F42F4BB